jgi:hypothetical protein
MNSASGSVSEVQDLEEVWLRAVDIARNKLQNRYVEVVREVAHRLAEVQRHAVAADLLKDALQVEEAVEVAMAGSAWDKARDVANGNSKLSEQVITKQYTTSHTRHSMLHHIIVVNEFSTANITSIELYRTISVPRHSAALKLMCVLI